MAELPFKISTLLFLRDAAGRFLLIRRRKAPNLNCWSPPGGKLEMASGESPFECAIREAREEVGLILAPAALHLWGMVSEKHFEASGHWLMFLFSVLPPVRSLPPQIDEGSFAFYSRSELESLALPPTDRVLLWPYYDRFHRGFVAYRVDCHPANPPEIVVEQSLEFFQRDAAPARGSLPGL